jgi:2-oxoglutarate ferredoxin oxidoreductase subunit alpha
MDSSPLVSAESARTELEHAVVRFAGDSGDGMQLTGSQFTLATALAGNDLSTFPDFPAEIRAPAGSTNGVSAFQIHFGAREIRTAGDEVDVLVAMNPAALKVNLNEVKRGGMIVLDSGAFTDKNLQKAGYDADPRHDGTLDAFRPIEVDISKQTLEAVKPQGLSKKDGLRCKNMWALGLICWMFGRDRTATEHWLHSKFAKKPTIAEANVAALRAGEAFGETAEMPTGVLTYRVPQASITPGLYRNVTGTEATAYGLVAGARLAGLGMNFCSYPITPASNLLHELAALKHFDVTTFQAEDEIAACCAAIGASYAGKIGVTSSSGPGIALKTEAIGLAISTELPLVVINSQRAGPSTGMPTKTEQSDLYQAVYGRNADAPLIVLAASSPADCFDAAIEAVRLSTRYMVPVMLLTDGYIANASEPWRIPDIDSYDRFPPRFRTEPEGFAPYMRDAATLARPWAVPGTPGLEHRIGGLEKKSGSGNISYDASNHQEMTDLRANKVRKAVESIPDQTVAMGADSGSLAVVGWGSTFGPITRAVTNLRREGKSVSHIHLRHIWPLPGNLGDLLRRFDKVIVPEMNNGQLVTLLRDQYLLPATGIDKVTGKPFKIAEIESAIRAQLEA